MGSLIKWVGGILAGVVIGVAVWQFTEGRRPPPPPPANRPTTTAPREMIINLSASPPQLARGGRTSISAEVLAAPGSPISGARVRLEVGGGRFTQTGALSVTGTTNPFGFFASEWECPSGVSPGYGYYFTATATKSGYVEKSQRILLRVR